jgi:hypothetical protein
MNLKKIKIENIVTDLGTNFDYKQAHSFTLENLRKEVNKDNPDLGFVDNCARTLHLLHMIKNNIKFEPILIVNGKLKDGGHRIWAHTLNGDSEIEALLVMQYY